MASGHPRHRGRAAADGADQRRLRADPRRRSAAAPRRPSRRRPRRRRAGHWLADDVRRALGAELLAALEDGEPVELVTRTSTWASPQTLLAVTDRRLLWLLDDAISHRVRSLAFKAITGAEVKQRRRSASLRVARKRGRPVEFAELPPATGMPSGARRRYIRL